MSEDASDQQLSRGSSLSLFSGFGGASTVSGGGSDPGIGGLLATGGAGAVNVEELTDDQLESSVDGLKTALRVLILETLMFESFYERLLAGQAQIRSTPSDSGLGTPGTGTELAMANIAPARSVVCVSDPYI